MNSGKDAMLKDIRLMLLAVMAGIAISVGGVLFLSVDVKIAGALLFTVGLYAVCAHGLNLYTGKVGYLPVRSPEFLIDLLLIWVGNLLGTILAAALVLFTRVKGIAATARTMCETKMADSFGSLFILGIFCGLLMFIAVDGYAKVKNPIILFLGVSAFILCGFEHCVADMFYFSVAGVWSFGVLLRVVVITLGNSLGGMLIPLIKKVAETEQ